MTDSTMSDIVSAVQNNDLEKLRLAVSREQATIPESNRDSANYPTQQMWEACAAAARHNHPKAMEILLDAGCFGSRGEFLVFNHVERRSLYIYIY